MLPINGPSRRPRKVPPNPFLRPDIEAEAAVCAAFFILDLRDKKPTEFELKNTATLRLHPNYEFPAHKVATDRIQWAMKAMASRGALEIPVNVLGACLLHGDSLHPETREYLGLPHLPHVPVEAGPLPTSASSTILPAFSPFDL